MKRTILTLLVTCMAPAWGNDWPHWRGPHFDGSAPSSGLPATFSPTENVRWKASLPGPAGSSPIVVGDWGGRTSRNDPGLVAAFTDLHLMGGGLWSTAADLLRFGRAMLRGGELDGTRIFEPRTLRRATTEQSYLELDFTLGFRPDTLSFT